MKNWGNGSRKAPGNLIRVIEAGLIVTAISVIWGAGPAMAADDASTPPDTAAGQGLVARILADHALTVEALVVLVGLALVLVYGHHRRSVGRRRSADARTGRSRAHARAGSIARTAASSPAGNSTARPGRPAAAGDPWISPLRPAAGQPLDADDYPSWPGRPGPYALHPDHPSWPGRPDPRWSATEAALRAEGYPGWPTPHPPSWRDAQPSTDGRVPGWPGGDGPAARREPPPGVRRAQHRPPAAAVPRVPATRARAGFAPRTDAASRVVIAPRPGPRRRESPAGVIDQARPRANWVQSGRVQVWDAGSVELATWIISEANQQAADIRHEARDQMAASLADARQEAADLVRKASEQATATVAAAELEVAEIRATITELSAELGGVAAQVTENLASFATPGTKPLTRPAARPVITSAGLPVAAPPPDPLTAPEARPAARSATKPGNRPESRPAARPGTRSAAKPKGAPRQLVAARVAAVATAALVLFALAAGTTEVALHGFPFFVFRSTGTGETGPSGLNEDQGPGQPDAPKLLPSHTTGQPSPDGTVTVHNGQ